MSVRISQLRGRGKCGTANLDKKVWNERKRIENWRRIDEVSIVHGISCFFTAWINMYESRKYRGKEGTLSSFSFEIHYAVNHRIFLLYG